MQPVKDASALKPGDVIYHQPRQHYYFIMHKTMIKNTGLSNGGKSWEYGWCYVEAELMEDGGFSYRLDGEYFTRPFSMFDSDWFNAAAV